MSKITPLGHKDDFNINDLPKGAVICGVSGLVFKNNEDYLAHTSPVTGFTPADPRHHGQRFIKQSREALLRGKAKTKGKKRVKLNAKEEKEFADMSADITKAKVDSNLAEEKVRPKKRKSL
jgi:hypothetical protein